MKTQAYVNVYLYLLKDDQVLLSMRQNTGYEDNKWCLVSGHVEEGESAIEGMIREAKEEIGIELDAQDLRLVHVVHRRTERNNVDLFLLSRAWRGEVKNQEPHKCGGVQFFPLSELPDNMVDFVERAMDAIGHHQLYSEVGWTEAFAEAIQL